MTVITKDEVLALLEEVVAEKGADYVHRDSCIYFRGNAPACIVGHVFAKLGLAEADFVGEVDTAEPITSWRTSNTWGIYEPRLTDWLPSTGVEFSSEALVALGHAQDAQDDQATWGQALNAASTGISWEPSHDYDPDLNDYDYA